MATEFYSLSIRVTVLETTTPNGEVMIKIHEGMASMQQEISQLAKSIDKLETTLMQNYRDSMSRKP